MLAEKKEKDGSDQRSGSGQRVVDKNADDSKTNNKRVICSCALSNMYEIGLQS